MDPLMHSKSSVKKWGGKVDDYILIHSWFDDSKRGYAFVTHRAMRHHSEGIGWCIDTFGKYITIEHKDKTRQIPVRYIAEQHVLEDCGFIPTMKDWLQHMAPPDWMRKVGELSK